MSFFPLILSFAGPAVPLSLIASSPAARLAQECSSDGMRVGGSGRSFRAFLRAFDAHGRPVDPFSLGPLEHRSRNPFDLDGERLADFDKAVTPYFAPDEDSDPDGAMIGAGSAANQLNEIDFPVTAFPTSDRQFPNPPLRSVVERYRVLSLANVEVTYSPFVCVEVTAWWLIRCAPLGPIPLVVEMSGAIVTQALVDVLAPLPVAAIRMTACSFQADVQMGRLFTPKLLDVSLKKVVLELAEADDISDADSSVVTQAEDANASRPFAFLGTLTNLCALSIDACHEFESKDVAFLHNCPHLRILRLRNLGGLSSIRAISGISSLRTLSIHSKRPLTLDGVGTCVGLEELDLVFTDGGEVNRDADARTLVLPDCSALTRLKKVVITSRELRDPSTLANCGRLAELSLCGCSRVSSIDSFASGPIASALRRLDVSETQLLHLPRNFSQSFPYLVSLNLRGTLIRFQDVKKLTDMQSLERLSVAGCFIEGFRHFPHIANLKYLDVSSLQNVAERDGAWRERNGMDNCGQDLPGVPDDSEGDDGEEVVVEGRRRAQLSPFWHLESLTCVFARHNSFPTGVPLAPALRFLDISRTANPSWEHVHVAQQLEILVAEGCQGGSSLAELAKLSSLVAVNLGEAAIADLSSLSGSCRTLRCAQLTHNRASSLAGVEQCEQLEYAFLVGVPLVTDAQPLSRLTRLRRVVLSGSPVSDLGCLQGSSSTLTQVDVRGNRLLRSLDRLFCGSQTMLVTLNISGTGVTDVSVLKNCASLQELIMVLCPGVHSIDCLNGMRHLATIAADRSGLTAVEHLDACPCLETVSVDGCRFLESVGGLAGALAIERLAARDCPALKKVGRSGKVGKLWCVEFVRCDALIDISALEREPRLQKLRVVECRNLSVLGKAGAKPGYKRLTAVVARDCPSLSDFMPLTPARRIAHLELSGTPVADLSPFHECITRSLKCLLLNSCEALLTLDALQTAVHLRHISASGAGLRSLGSLSPGCVNLSKVDVTKCAKLDSLNALGGLPNLKSVDARKSGILTASKLSECPKLRQLFLDGCSRLRRDDRRVLQSLTHLVSSSFPGP